MDTELLDLGAKCTIIRAEELHTQMETLLQSGLDVEIDASKVEQIDTSALQLLLSFHQTLENDGRNVLWKSPSDQLLTTAKLLGVDQHLAINSH
jgi:phospholipid transport system transporter-binding protein